MLINQNNQTNSPASLVIKFAVIIFLVTFGIIDSNYANASDSDSDSDSDSEQGLSQSHIKQDFRQLYRDLQIAHYDVFANIDKTQYDKAFQNWLLKIDRPMSTSEVRLLFQQFMALGKIAHARIELPMQEFMTYLDEGGRMFPAYFRLKENKAWLDVFYTANEHLKPGQEVIAINGEKVDIWLQKIATYISSDNQQLTNSIIENTLPWYMWLIMGEQESFDLEVKENGKTMTVTLPAIKSEQRADLRRAPSEQPEENMQSMATRITPDGIGYLRPGPFYNIQPGAKDIWDNSRFLSFIDNAFNDFKKQNVSAVLIDLRNNPGGTNSFSDPIIARFAHTPFRFASKFLVKASPHSHQANEARIALSGEDETSLLMREFYQKHQAGDTFIMSLPDAQPNPEKPFTKPVFVLINRFSYSNAVSFAAIVKDYDFATVLGEKTADLATTYGAMEHFTLQHSKITVGYPKALIVRPNGDMTPDGVSPDFSLTKTTNLSLLDKALQHINDLNLQDKTSETLD